MDIIFIIYSLVAGSLVFAFIHKHFRMMYFGFKTITLSWLFTCFITGAVTVAIFGSIFEKFTNDDSDTYPSTPIAESVYVDNDANSEKSISLKYFDYTLKEIEDEFGTEYHIENIDGKEYMVFNDEVTIFDDGVTLFDAGDNIYDNEDPMTKDLYTNYMFGFYDINSKDSKVSSVILRDVWKLDGIHAYMDKDTIIDALGVPNKQGMNGISYDMVYDFENCKITLKGINLFSIVAQIDSKEKVYVAQSSDSAIYDKLSFNYIGSTLSEIKKEFGTDYSELTYKDKPTIRYENNYEFIFDELDDDSKVVGAVLFQYPWEIMGINEGAYFKEIEENLGDPYSKGVLEENDELYMMEYHFSNGI